ADFARRIGEELGVAPSVRVRALAARHAVATPSTPVATEFVGRRNELRELQAILLQPECRILTVTGPGGIGKSSLVKHALRELAPDFADGAFWIALDDLTDNAQVEARIAGELGLETSRARDRLLAVRAHVKSKRMLLALDNCEHLDRLPALIERLSTNSPHLPH